MFLLVVDEAAAVGPGPGALVALVRMFSGVTPAVVDQVVRALELFATKVASVSELGLVHQLVLFQGVLQLEGHATIFASKVSDVGVDLQVDMVGGDLVECLAALLAAPAVASDTVGPQVDVHTVTGLELLPALVAAVGTICNIVAQNSVTEKREVTRLTMGMFEENVQLHVTLPVKLARTLRTRITSL